MNARLLATALLLTARIGRADPAVAVTGAAAATAAPAPTVTASATAEPAHHNGLALGAELGDPISGTVAWYANKLVLGAAVGTATLESLGWTAHADAQYTAVRLGPTMTFRTGLGLRFYHHSHLMSPDEVPSSHVGIRLPNALAVQIGSAELYGEVAPGIDFLRTNSCNLSHGAYSVCPHAQENPLFIEMVVGLRIFLSH